MSLAITDLIVILIFVILISFFLIFYLLGRKWKKEIVEVEVPEEKFIEIKEKRIEKLYKKYWKAGPFTTAYSLLYIGEGYSRTFFTFFITIRLLTEFNFTPVNIALFVTIAWFSWKVKMIIGLVSDYIHWGRFGRRRPYIAIGTIIGIIAAFYLGKATDPWTEILPLGVIFLFGIAIIDVACDAFLLDVVPPDHHGWIMGGLPWFCRGLGGLLATGLGGVIIEKLGWSMAFSISGLVLATNFLFLLFKEPPMTKERAITKRSIALTFTSKYVLYGIIFSLLASLGGTITSMSGMFGLVANYLVGPLSAGFLGSTVMAGEMLGSLIGGKLSDKIGHKKTYLMFQPIFSIVVALWMFVQPGMFNFALAMGFMMGLINNIVFGARISIMADLTQPGLSATMFQAFMSSSHVAGTLSALLFAYTLDSFGWNGSFLIMAVVSLAGIIPCYFIKPHPEGKAIKI